MYPKHQQCHAWANSVSTYHTLHCLLFQQYFLDIPSYSKQTAYFKFYVSGYVVCVLTFITLWASSADDKLTIFFLFFCWKTGFDISCKLSPPLETICKKMSNLFSGKKKKKKKVFQNVCWKFCHVKCTDSDSSCACGVSAGHLLSTDTFYSIQWFC